MLHHSQRGLIRVVTLPLLSLALLLAAAGVCIAQAPPAPPAAAPADPAADPAAVAAEQASRWPLVVQSGGDEVVMYQPQLESLNGDVLTARAAVSVRKAGQQDPVFGVVWLQSRAAVDRVARTVQILDANITKARFPDAQPDDQQALADAIRQRIADHPRTLSLDQLLAMLEVVSKEQAADEKLQSNPPKILFVDHPAVKVQYDGAPRLVRVENSPLLRAANTPFFVVLEPTSKTYFLKGATQWFSAPDPLGPFQRTSGVPAPVSQLADQSGYTDPDQQTANAAGRADVEILTATEPTELIWTDGREEWGTLAGTALLYITNTDSDVFLNIQAQDLYVLLSGRWYTSRDRQGPWTFVAPDKLPADFARIPPGSPKGSVLAHVAGTTAARDAVMDTYVPQTAAIDRAKVERPTVTYDGEPKFEPVEGTTMQYAVNTPYSVVLVDRRYYCCHNAVWYACEAPVGPWEVCVSVPTQVYTLPPSCPIYPVRYCHVYSYTPEVVYCGYTPGYVGCFRYGGCVVYGTGYYYRPWVTEVHYYPRPFTFGFAARYDAYAGSWGFEVGSAFGDVAYVSFLGGGGGRFVHERIVPGGHWFGYGGYRPVSVGNEVNIRNVTINRTVVNRVNVTEVNRVRLEQSRNLYERRTDVRREFGRVRPAGRVEPAREVRGGPVRTEGGPNRPELRRNDVYADPEGNVHRKTLDGWEARQGNRWVPQPRTQQPGREPVRAPAREPVREPAREPVREPARQPVRERARETPHEIVREPVRTPAREPAREAPRTGRGGSLDRDFQARVAGRDRYQNAPRPAPSRAVEPAPAPRSRGPGRSGDRGGDRGGDRVR